jgi:hypothetical protein
MRVQDKIRRQRTLARPAAPPELVPVRTGRAGLPPEVATTDAATAYKLAQKAAAVPAKGG